MDYTKRAKEIVKARGLNVVKEAKISCPYFKKDDETCTTGCKTAKVIKGNSCPYAYDDEGYGGETQLDCPCNPNRRKAKK